jgi:hypothetical protein
MQSNDIKVGSKCYSVYAVDDETFDLILAQKSIYDSEIKSFIEYDDQLIIVRARLSPEHRHELVLHELLHACLEDAGIQQTDDHETFIKILSPRINSLIDSGLFNLIKQF